jgi:hypothetical protein
MKPSAFRRPSHHFKATSKNPPSMKYHHEIKGLLLDLCFPLVYFFLFSNRIARHDKSNTCKTTPRNHLNINTKSSIY